MYISIDMEALRFLHKHENHNTVADLDYICGKGKVVSMGPTGCADIFSHFTHVEKERLFENTTGKKPTTTTPAFNSVLAELAEKVPVTQANSFEADRQAAWLERYLGDPKLQPTGYVYVFGATVPGQGQPLLFPAVTITPEECGAALRKHAALAPRPAPAPVVAAPASAPHKPAPARYPGGAKRVIWEVADQIWEAEGSPKGREIVLALRKKIMEVLEEKNQIKKTTSSNELGNWMKARI